MEFATKSKTEIAAGFITVISAVIYFWSFYRLGEDPSLALVLVLFAPAALYLWWYRGERPQSELLSSNSSKIFATYTLLYLAATHLINILASSVALWLVLFVIPLVILKLLKEPLTALMFRWRGVFVGGSILLLAVLVLTPGLVMIVRDSEQILAMAGTWKAIVYLPLSVLYMAVIVAFWEEFFFRGIVLSSCLRLMKSPVIAIITSAILFSTYHVPMRYMNSRSEFHGDLLSSIAATINEQFILGVFLGLIVYKSRNVWHGVWLHAFINGVSYMYKLSSMIRF